MSRVRTESMIQRLSKKPMSEGFDLWDKDYLLGALRLFQCKLESSPPFEVAPCLEAIATILHIIDEADDAVDHFNLASDKYNIIQKTIVGSMMKAKVAEISEGPEAALKLVNDVVEKSTEATAKDKIQLGRVYTYRADLHGKLKDFAAGLADCEKALSLGPGRMEAHDLDYITHHQMGNLHQALGNVAEAEKCYTQALQCRKQHFPSSEALIPIKQHQNDLEGALQCINDAFELHPKANLLRQKAFLLSEMGRDEEGLKVIDEGIANPPHEETEALSGCSSSTATLYKSKAAILADAGRLDEARAALQGALDQDPGDVEAVRMSADISTTLSREYLSANGIPQFLDSLVKHLLTHKPEDAIGFMVKAIETDAVPLP